MPRIIVADASPLIGLATAGALDLLRELFGSVTVTRLVKDEVAGRGDRPGAPELDAALRAGWLRVAPTPMETWVFEDLGAGEASTIALAAANPGALVLMDDVAGRVRAAAHGLEVLDIAGVLLAAKRAGLIAAVQPLVGRLARGGFTLSEEMRNSLLREADELPAAST